MKKIGIFYGSTTGTTEDVAEGIAKRLGVDKKDIHNVADTAPVAIFGCGDEQMASTFCNSVGEIYHRLHDTHAMFIAPFENDPYTYEHSDSNVKGMIVGLCLDNVNHPEDTDARLDAWCEIIKEEIK